MRWRAYSSKCNDGRPCETVISLGEKMEKCGATNIAQVDSERILRNAMNATTSPNKSKTATHGARAEQLSVGHARALHTPTDTTTPAALRAVRRAAPTAAATAAATTAAPSDASSLSVYEGRGWGAVEVPADLWGHFKTMLV